MTAAAPVAGSPGLQFRLAGFPVSIRWSFFLVVAVIGATPPLDAVRLAIWVGVAFVSVMLHELGHAVAAHRLGADPSIELYGMGGLTRWSGVDPSRTQMIGVTLAGPGAGLIVGAAVGAGVLLAGTTGSGDVRYFVLVVLWINIGWGLANLLPVLPLDGGHVFAELLPGDRPTRTRRAAMLSIGIGIVGGFVLLAVGFPFGLILCGWAVITNWSVLRADRERDRLVSLADRAGVVVQRVAERDATATADAAAIAAALHPRNGPFRLALIETAAAVDSPAVARLMLDAPGDQLPPGAYALTFLAESGGSQGVEEMIDIFRRDPSEAHARWVTIALHRAGRAAELPTLIADAPPAAHAAASETGRLLSAGAPPGTHREPPAPSPPGPAPSADR
ncbi:MAG: site-2 protease family protein [Actinomycetota bacterium]